MIFRNGINCGRCKEKYSFLQSESGEVIRYFFDNLRKEIRFYQSVFLEELHDESIKKYAMKIKKIPSKEPDCFDYLFSCPLCKKYTMKYSNVPPDWNVVIGSQVGLNVISIPLDEILQYTHRKGEANGIDGFC